MKQTKYRTLKAWREDRGFTQMQAAAELGLSYRTYTRYENGESFLSGEKLRDLMSKTQVAMESLVGLTA